MSSERSAPRWLTRAITLAIHADQIRQHGGASGVRDVKLLESALGRSVNRWQYDPEADLPSLAAAYGVGIAKDHPFVDGNKRTAFKVMYVFLGLNGVTMTAEEPEVVSCVEALAACDLDEDGLTRWLRRCTKPR